MKHRKVTKKRTAGRIEGQLHASSGVPLTKTPPPSQQTCKKHYVDEMYRPEYDRQVRYNRNMEYTLGVITVLLAVAMILAVWCAV